MTQDSESRPPRTPMEKARAAVRSGTGTGTETGTAVGGTSSGGVSPGGDERTGPVAGAAGHREAGAVGTSGAGAAGTGAAGAAGRDAGLGTTPTGATSTGTTATEQPGTAGDGGGHGAPLLPRDECDDLASRMQHAVVGFVDGPRDAVAEADHVLEELAARVTDAVNQRRRTLRGSWQLAEGGKAGRTDRTGTAGEATGTDTEQLRLALRDYRELTERLLHV
ncbi:hypothetical protein [Streptomyces sp. NPDC001381]|uniref:hypothetical protein n=1 Tax=Streptomyces sp. NPDC001381 TaxID=3364567 RepID=UPI0036BE0DB1